MLFPSLSGGNAFAHLVDTLGLSDGANFSGSFAPIAGTGPSFSLAPGSAASAVVYRASGIDGWPSLDFQGDGTSAILGGLTSGASSLISTYATTSAGAGADKPWCYGARVRCDLDTLTNHLFSLTSSTSNVQFTTVGPTFASSTKYFQARRRDDFTGTGGGTGVLQSGFTVGTYTVIVYFDGTTITVELNRSVFGSAAASSANANTVDIMNIGCLYRPTNSTPLGQLLDGLVRGWFLCDHVPNSTERGLLADWLESGPTVTLAGAIAGIGAVAGSLVLSGSMSPAGQVAGIGAVTGLLNANNNIALGSAFAGVSAAAGTIIAPSGALVGVAAGIAGQSGVLVPASALALPGNVAGIAAQVGGFSAQEQVTPLGVAAGIAAQSGVLAPTSALALSGNSAGIAGQVGGLQLPGVLSGASAGISGQVGAFGLSIAQQLTPVTAGVGGQVGTLGLSPPIGGVQAGITAQSGTISFTATLQLAGVAASISAQRGFFQTIVPLSGTFIGITAQGGSLNAFVTLGGAISIRGTILPRFSKPVELSFRSELRPISMIYNQDPIAPGARRPYWVDFSKRFSSLADTCQAASAVLVDPVTGAVVPTGPISIDSVTKTTSGVVTCWVTGITPGKIVLRVLAAGSNTSPAQYLDEVQLGIEVKY